MKIEMGESLFYSWLRHVKECQIVQTNWKASSQWTMQNGEEARKLYRTCIRDLDAGVFKQTASFEQFLRQAECDVMGVAIQEGKPVYHAVDVAFHENGLNYGSREETVYKVIAKCVRTALCLLAYMDTKKAEIVFASPKILKSMQKSIEEEMEKLNALFLKEGFEFHVRLICNEMFRETVLEPILLSSSEIADTSELFLRAYQMQALFEKEKRSTGGVETVGTRNPAWQEMRIGKLANTVLRGMLQDGCADGEEIEKMKEKEYSHQAFGLQYPLLMEEGEAFDASRYYAQPVEIEGKLYFLCSQWFETLQNNDRPLLEAWLEAHEKKEFSRQSN